MTDIPNEAVEAARQAFRKHAEWRYRHAHTARGTCICGETLPVPSPHREFGRHQMTKILEAAAPHLRAEIAEEVRDLRSQFHDDAKTAFGRIGSSTEAYLNALDDVLALLEGGGE